MDGDAFDDWYVYESGGAAFAVTMSGVPSNLEGQVLLYDVSNPSGYIQYELGAAPGSDVRASLWAGACGTCLVRVGALWDADAAHGSGATLPDNFTRAYTLAIEAR